MTGSWSILRKLGEGGRGAVSLALAPSGEKVAVKTLLAPDENSAAAFEHEASLLLRLRHEGIARIQGYLKNSSEIFGRDQGPCFWMEFVDGPDAVSAANLLGEDGKDAIVLRWFLQALEALQYLHAENVVHGDLTPQNIRIGADGRLKLIDFGFASVGRSEIPPDGTLLYMAPERFQGLKDESGDLFSLGTVFYEALAGSHPRAGRRSLTDMFRDSPRSLLEARPSLASRFSVEARVIDALVSAKAADRFSSPDEALRAIRSRGLEKKKSSEAYFSRMFYGADDFLAAVDEAMRGKGDKASFFAVHGPSGTGKTRFLEELVFRGGLAGRAVKDFSFERFSIGLEKLESSPSCVFVFRNLENVPRSELSRVLSIHRTTAPGAVVALEWNDDVIDEESRHLLLHSPVAVRWTDVSLRDFDEVLSRDFLSRALGGSVAGEVAEDLFKATHGNPRLLGDWVTFFGSRGWSERAHFPKNWREACGALPNETAFFEARWGSLDSLERAFLEALAIDGGPAAFEELAEVVRGVCGAQDDESFGWSAVEALERLQSNGFIAAAADERGLAVYRFALESIGRSVRSRVDEARERILREAWLKALAAVPEENPRKIRHRIAFKDAARFVPALENACLFLRRADRHREALALADLALAQVDAEKDAAFKSRLLRVKTNVLNEMGRYREALVCCEENLALAAADEPLILKRVKYWMVSGLIFENLGDAPEALKRFRSCAGEAVGLEGDPRASYLARSFTLIGKQLLDLGDSEEAETFFEKALEAAVSLVRERAEACRNLAAVRARRNLWNETISLLEDARALYRSDAYPAGEFAVLLLKGNLARERDDLKAAEAAYAEAEELALERRDELLLARVWNNQGVIARLSGDLARALERGQRSLEIFRALGNPADLSESLKQNIVTEAELGRFLRADSLMNELKDMAAADRSWVDKVSAVQKRLAFLRHGEGEGDASVSGPEEKSVLEKTYASLPKELQVCFLDRADCRKWGVGH